VSDEHDSGGYDECVGREDTGVYGAESGDDGPEEPDAEPDEPMAKLSAICCKGERPLLGRDDGTGAGGASILRRNSEDWAS